jgi:hypothetical protein
VQPFLFWPLSYTQPSLNGLPKGNIDMLRKDKTVDPPAFSGSWGEINILIGAVSVALDSLVQTKALDH